MARLLSIFGALAALVLVAASAFMNLQYVSGWGMNEINGQIFGAISIALDVLKALLPFYILWAFKNKRIAPIALGSFLFACLVTFSLLSALGFAAQNRTHITEKKQTITTAFMEIERDLEEVKNRRDKQPEARAVAVVLQAIESKKINRRFTSSKSCTDVTAKKSRVFCREYFALKAEMGAARERARLQQEIATLKGKRDTLRTQGAGQQADPQAGLLAKLTGLEIADTQTALIVFVAVLVEMAAAFGLYIATAHGGIAAPITPKIQKPRKASNDNKKTQEKAEQTTTSEREQVINKLALTLA